MTVALYARVSTEEQTERNTIQGQLDFLRNYANLYKLGPCREYLDDGISGTVPLGERPGGYQLLQEAPNLSTVVVYKLDRLARTLSVTLDAYQRLDAHSVVIKSANEPFDTSTPFGKFLFQFLGSLAELERSTITERMVMGRTRVAREGKWTTGPIPLGYQADEGGKLIPSPEAQIVQDLFTRISEGSTSSQEALRLNSLGIPHVRRFANGSSRTQATWGSSSVRFIIHNSIYRGEYSIESRLGPVPFSAPVLVTPEVWYSAVEQLKNNVHKPKGNEKREYLLSGLITCGLCGSRYTGSRATNGKGWARAYYRCSGQQKGYDGTGERCAGPGLPADKAEEFLWDECATIIKNPEPVLAQLHAKAEAHFNQKSQYVEQRKLQTLLLAKAQEKGRIEYLFTKGHIPLTRMEEMYATVDAEISSLKQELAGIQSQTALEGLYRQYFSSTSALLKEVRSQLQHPTDEQKRRVFQRFISAVVVQPGIVLEYTLYLKPEGVVVSSSMLKHIGLCQKIAFSHNDFVHLIRV